MNTRLLRAVFSSRVLAVAVSGFVASAPLVAQETASAPDETIKLDEYIVTGSHIPMSETAGDAKAIPVTIVDEEILTEMPAVSLGDLLQKLNVTNGGAIPISNNATGFTPAASSVSLRGLGPEATLVLIGGRRVAPYPIGAGGTSAFVDLNTIPVEAVKSVEILRDGGTAIYGADAVAGVVNIKMKNDLRGVTGNFEKGWSTHGDYEETAASMAIGVGNEKTNVSAVLAYFTNTAIYNKDRDYSLVPPFLSGNASAINLSGLRRQVVAEARGQGYDTTLVRGAGVDSSSNFPIGDGGATFDTTVGWNEDGSGILNTGLINVTTGAANADDLSPLPGNMNDSNDGTLGAGDYLIRNGLGDNVGFGVASRYNYNETSGSFPESKRTAANVSFDHEITDTIQLYGTFMYSEADYVNELAPTATGGFFRPGATQLVIPARTPNPTPWVVLDDDPSIDPEAPLPHVDDRVWLTVTEAGIPANTTVAQSSSIREQSTVTDRIAPLNAYNPWNPFNEDISGGSSFRTAEFGNRIYRTNNIATLFDIGLRGRLSDKFNYDVGYRNSGMVTTTDDTLVSASLFNRILNQNDPIFQEGGQFAGMPAYNPFGYYRNPIESNFALTDFANVRLKDKSTTSLSDFWVDLSSGNLWELATGNIGAALGYSYRSEGLTESPDTINRNGDTIGSSPKGEGTNASRDIQSLYGSVRLPITSPDNEIPFMYATTLEASIRYEDFRTSDRSTWSPKLSGRWLPIEEVALRASWGEGYREPSLYELFGGPTQALQNIYNPRNDEVQQEVPILRLGNPFLLGEDTTSANVGAVWTPTWRYLKGWTFGVDVWRITRNGYVNLPDADDVIEAWEAGDPMPATFVEFDEATNDIVLVGRAFQNVNEFEVEGWDFSVGYVLPTDNWGVFNFDLGGSYFTKYDFDGVNQIGEATSYESNNGYLEWKASLRLGWKFKGFNLTLTPRYTDGFLDYYYDSDFNVVEREVESTVITDLYLSYDLFGINAIADQSWLKGASVWLKVRNLFGVEPPYANGYAGNSVGYPAFLYDSRGTVISLGAGMKF